jgi:hypothetical protein
VLPFLRVAYRSRITGTNENNHEDTQKTFHALAASFERQGTAKITAGSAVSACG